MAFQYDPGVGSGSKVNNQPGLSLLMNYLMSAPSSSTKTPKTPKTPTVGTVPTVSDTGIGFTSDPLLSGIPSMGSNPADFTYAPPVAASRGMSGY